MLKILPKVPLVLLVLILIITAARDAIAPAGGVPPAQAKVPTDWSADMITLGVGVTGTGQYAMINICSGSVIGKKMEGGQEVVGAGGCLPNPGNIFQLGTCTGTVYDHTTGPPTPYSKDFTDVCFSTKDVGECAVRDVDSGRQAPMYFVAPCPGSYICRDGVCADPATTAPDYTMPTHDAFGTGILSPFLVDVPAEFSATDVGTFKIGRGNFPIATGGTTSGDGAKDIGGIYGKMNLNQQEPCQFADGSSYNDKCIAERTLAKCWIQADTVKYSSYDCPPTYVCSLTENRCVSPTDKDADGYVDSALGGDDCDDNDPNTNPGAAEICADGTDNNCNAAMDEEVDDDGDGYVTCTDPSRPTDCDDTNPNVYPGAPEICGNGIDDNCDGLTNDYAPPYCQGDISEASCSMSYYGHWLATTGNQQACCGDDFQMGAGIGFKGESWSMVGQPNQGCFMTMAMVLGDDSSPGSLIGANYGGPVFSWTGGYEESNDRLTMTGTELTSSYIFIPRAYLYGYIDVSMDLNISDPSGNNPSFTVTIEEGRSEADGTFTPYPEPFATETMTGTTANFIRVFYSQHFPQNWQQADNDYRSHALGLRIKFTRNTETNVMMQNLKIRPGVPSQIAYHAGQFYSCGGVWKYLNPNAEMEIMKLHYTTTEGADNGQLLIPTSNQMTACNVTGELYCDTGKGTP